MDPVIATLAGSVIAVLTPYVKQSAEEFARFAGQAAYEKTKSLLESLKARWADDKEASETLERFQEKPERYQPVLNDILEEKLSKDQALASDIGRQLKEMGPVLEIIQKIKEGENITGLEAGQVSGGKARVSQEIEKGKGVTGAKIDRLG